MLLNLQLRGFQLAMTEHTEFATSNQLLTCSVDEFES